MEKKTGNTKTELGLIRTNSKDFTMTQENNYEQL
jgi:hypothetical protein